MERYETLDGATILAYKVFEDHDGQDRVAFQTEDGMWDYALYFTQIVGGVAYVYAEDICTGTRNEWHDLRRS